MSGATPGPEELRAYCAGALPPERFAAVDRWLAEQDAGAAERALEAAGALAGGAALAVEAEAPAEGFASALPRGRLRRGERLGEGGMAVVDAAFDRVLERAVAIKVLRPRRGDEPLEHYHLREAAFQREAALTAALEHPAIPPVYDVGRDGGQPAFAMQRLDGRPLEAVVRAGAPPLAEGVAILLRVAEAVGYAHSRGVVHRDLTPHNILVADFGAVYVVDWGLAARIGGGAGVRAGTPAWMAPEQAAAGPADPRMDVFALGAVAMLLLTGAPPRRDAAGAPPDLAPLAAARLPTGLAALVRRCLAADPAARYGDGGAVAADLRRWLGEGATLAQQATRWELAWLRLRRSPRVATGLAVGAAAALLAAGLWQAQAWRTRAEAAERIARLGAATALERSEAVGAALGEVRAIRRRLPGLAEAQALEARLQAALDLAERAEREAQVRGRIDRLLHRTRTRGPWADQVQDWRQAIRDAGLELDPGRVAADADRLRGHPLRADLAAALAFLWRAERERGAGHHAAGSAALLAEGGPAPGWRALGRQLADARFAAHDPLFAPGPDAAAILAEPGAAAVALALFAPEPGLTAAARRALEERPGGFWPLVAAARASLADGDAAAAERLAWTAAGAEPESVLPPLVLAYAALARGDQAALERAAARARALAPGNSEVAALQAVALARGGRTAEAQALVDALDAGHLQYHLRHRVGHPMERSVDALVGAGLRIPPAPAQLGALGD